MSDYSPRSSYASVEIPDDKDRTDYTWEERRADIYRRIRENGFGNIDSRADMGDDYGVAPNQIQEDIERLRKYIVEVDFKQANVKSAISNAMQKALKLAEESDDADDIRKVAKDYMKIMQSVGAVEEEPDKLEVEGDLDVSGSLRESFSKYHGDSAGDADSDTDSVSNGEDSQVTNQ